MQRIQESPERGLHRQLGDFQDARQNRITSDKAQLVQPRKADIEPQYDSQHEPVQVHDTGDALRGHRLFHQGLKVELMGYLLDSGSPYRLWFRFRGGFGLMLRSRVSGPTATVCCARRKKSLPRLFDRRRLNRKVNSSR